jgi:hypothetical protein
LRAANWRVVRVWEHEDSLEAAKRIVAVIRRMRSRTEVTLPPRRCR